LVFSIVREAGLASSSDVRPACHCPKGISLHGLSTRREIDAGLNLLPSGAEIAGWTGRCRPASSLNRYLLALRADGD
jgi:hypothetical protein